MGFYEVDRTAGVAVATLDKPPANTIDYSMLEELSLLLADLEADESVRALVFTSAHPTIFMAGADIKEMADYDRRMEPVARKIDTVRDTFLRLQRLAKPTLGAITGHALGGGCEFGLCLDFRIMNAQGATIGLPEVGLGIIPGGGGTQRLARLVGRPRATEMLMLGSRLSAAEALEAGLVNRVGADRDETLELTMDLAGRLAQQAPVAIRLIKRALQYGVDGDLERGLAVEREAAIEAVLSKDAAEGAAAFLEKRRPRFEGR